jgi:serine protein kinase
LGCSRSADQNNRNNEAFIDRIHVIKVPYCLRVTEEQKIYEKLVRTSELAASPCAPATLEMLARFSVLTRLRRATRTRRCSPRCGSTTARA